MRHLPIILSIVATLAGCARPIRVGAVIDLYTSADCLPLKLEPLNGRNRTRRWDYTLTLRDGSRVRMKGIQAPGGRIDLEYLGDGLEKIAAQSGDYIYPADVRFAANGDRLYVKTSGAPAAFGAPQTWLFEYDLQQRQQTKRVLVDPTVLPPECPETQ